MRVNNFIERHTVLLNAGEKILTSDCFVEVGGRIGLMSILAAILLC
jgi:hypothetical protein